MYTKIDQLIWSDAKYRKLSNDTKLLFLYLMSCSHRNMVGMYFLPIPYGAYDLNWEIKTFTKGLVELVEKGFITYNFETNIVVVKNFLRYNSLENPNQVKGAIKAIDALPANSINVEIIDYLNTLDNPVLKPLVERLREGCGTVAKGFRNKEEEEEEEEEEKEEKEEKGKEVYIVPQSVNSDIPEKKKESPNKQKHIEITNYLNERLGSRYRATSKELIKLINGRISDGYVVQDFKEVIDKKCAEWTGTEMSNFLRPSTLFAPSHFEEYLNQKTIPKKSSNAFMDIVDDIENGNKLENIF